MNEDYEKDNNQVFARLVIDGKVVREIARGGKIVGPELLVRQERFRHELKWKPHIGYASWIASWLLLRWLEHRDEQQEKNTAIDRKNYKRLIPEELIWQRIINLPVAELSKLYRDVFLSQSGRFRNTPGGMLLQGMPPVFEQVELFTEPAFEAMKHIVGPFDFSHPNHKKLALETLDSIIYDERRKTRSSEFYTPKSVVDLMVELGDPQIGERIYDPCFGIGSLLVECCRRITQKGKTDTEEEREDLAENLIFGIEINPFAYAIAAARIVLAGAPEATLELGDALLRPQNPEVEGYDLVLATPPWGYNIDLKKDRRYGHFKISSRNSTNLFVQHVLQSLSPKGRAIIAVPEGTLFRGGADRKLREWILSEFRLDKVISLPADTFTPFTNIKTNLLIVRRDLPADSVYFYQSSKDMPSFETGSVKELQGKDDARLSNKRMRGITSWLKPVSELRDRECILVVQDDKETLLSEWLDKICASEAGVRRVRLRDVARIAGGVRYDRKTTKDKPSRDNDVSLVRISDIQEGKLRHPSLFIENLFISPSSNESILRPNDILVSRKGTIGKVAIIEPEQSGLPAAASQALAIIRCRAVILPGYLFALLSSANYRQWMEGHAWGAAIKNLSLENLRSLPVPLPDILLQEHFLKLLKERKNIDPLALLAELVLEKEKNSTQVAEEIDLAAIAAKLPEAITAHEPVERAKQAAGVYLLFLKLFKDEDAISYWYGGAEKAIKNLISIDKYPKGSAMYCVLREALSEVWYADMYIEFVRPVNADDAFSTFIDTLNSFVIKELKHAANGLLDSCTVTAALKQNVIPVGIEKELEVAISNIGFLPLTDLHVDIGPGLGEGTINYLGENSTETISFTLPKQRKAGRFDFLINWSAKRIDGNEKSGTADLAIGIKSISDAVHGSPLGPSPYVTGSPIEANRPEMFFGRQDMLDSIKRQLPTSHRANIILLEGNRRSGKTSILNQLSRPGVLEGWITVYCNFQGGTGDALLPGLPTNEIFKLLAKTIFSSVLKEGKNIWFPGVPIPDKTGLMLEMEFAKVTNQVLSDERCFESFELFLHSALHAIAPKRLLLLLDEFDKIQEGIDSGITSPQVPENLRYLLHAHPDISAILSYSKLLRKLRNEYWSMLFGLGHRVTVGPLGGDDAKQLVTRPAEGKLVYTDRARDKIICLCALQPFLIQQLCNSIYDNVVESGQRNVTERMVDLSAAQLTKENEHFRTLWDHHVGSERRKFILALCESCENGPDPLDFRLLEIKLGEARIYSRNRFQTLSDDLSHLKDLELLTMHDNGSRYTLAIPLMALWIRSNVDFEEQKRKAQHESEESLL